MQSPPSDKDLVDSLKSTTCPACARTKQVRKTFCPGCYFSLPEPMQKATYNLLRRGYVEAVVAAMDFLKAGTFILPRPKKPDAPGLFGQPGGGGRSAIGPNR